MVWPSLLSTFTDPSPTDKLSTTPHSSIETVQNTGIKELQAFIGTESSVVGTLMYDIRGAGSNGGGHVQTANKGGTGQTAYTKGDVLVATSSSVLTKLAVGVDGNVLAADSTTATGLAYTGVATEKAIQDQTYVYAAASVLSASVYGITFANRVSVLSAGQSFAVKFPTANSSSVIALQVSSLLALRIKNQDLSNPEVGTIQASMIGILQNDGTQFQLLTPSSTSTFVSALTDTGNITSTQNVDTAFATTFLPKAITIQYYIRGMDTSVAYLSQGTAVYNGATIVVNNGIYLETGNGANVTANTAYGVAAPSAGANAGAVNCVATLTITAISGTGFTVRAAFAVVGGGTGQVKFVAIANK